MKFPDIHFLKFNLFDFLDILAVAVIVYFIFNLLKGTIAVNIFIGICLITLFYWVVRTLHMELLTGILDKFLSVGVIALIIIFQQEIRRFLLLLGKNFSSNRAKFWARIFSGPGTVAQEGYDKLKPVLEACKSMQLSKTGALIIFARNYEEQVFQNNGEAINALISRRLLESIFNKYSPLHDGAVVIAENTIKVASCILPLTDSNDIPLNFGLRHRAGIGITEQSNSVALIVSEETGEIAIARDGKLRVNVSLPELERILHKDVS